MKHKNINPPKATKLKISMMPPTLSILTTTFIYHNIIIPSLKISKHIYDVKIKKNN